MTWQKPTPGFTKNYSAIAYWFGDQLQKELGVPVGIINNSYGGTTIQAWLPLETLRGGPWPQDKAPISRLPKPNMTACRGQAAGDGSFPGGKAAAQKEKRPGPVMFAGWPGEFRGPSVLWNGEVAPLLPFRIRGVAWYQGESNAYAGGPATHYREMLLALIRDWRTGFGQPEMPFLIFQIARNRQPQTDPNEPSGIAELQEAQLKAALATPHAALVVTNDLGGPDVHYRNKAPAANRAVKVALVLAYGRDVKSAGPVLREAKFDEAKALLRFDHADGGLAAHDGELKGFVIAGEDRGFVFAEARTDGDTILVSSPQVPKPVAVRYGWADLPQVNLFNGEGFPASPFRTDDWPLGPAKPPRGNPPRIAPITDRFHGHGIGSPSIATTGENPRWSRRGATPRRAPQPVLQPAADDRKRETSPSAQTKTKPSL